MLMLSWRQEGRECTASFRLEVEARHCAAILARREGIEGMQLLDAEGVPLERDAVLPSR